MLTLGAAACYAKHHILVLLLLHLLCLALNCEFLIPSLVNRVLDWYIMQFAILEDSIVGLRTMLGGLLQMIKLDIL